MAYGTQSNMVIYQDQFYSGFLEAVDSNLEVFNQASRGAVTLTTMEHRGQRKERAFFLKTSNIYHRDPTSTATRTPTSLTADDVKAIKIKKGAFDSFTLDSFADQGISIEQAVFLYGQNTADNIMAQWRDSAFSALVGAYNLSNIQPGGADELVFDATDGTLESADLINSMKLLGDKSSKVRMLVMHSKVYYDLMGNQNASTTADGVADMTIMEGTVATMGIPVLVADIPALINDNGSAADTYNTFALVEGALSVEESQIPRVLTEEKSGFDNLVLAIQSEWSYTIGLKGISWEGATTNPTDAQLGTNTNWSQVFDSKKNLPGIMIESL